MGNKIISIIDDCTNCKYCDNNGMLQTHPKYICQHENVPKRHKSSSIKYWYEYPVLGEVGKVESVSIPDWCPRLQENT